MRLHYYGCLIISVFLSCVFSSTNNTRAVGGYFNNQGSSAEMDMKVMERIMDPSRHITIRRREFHILCVSHLLLILSANRNNYEQVEELENELLKFVSSEQFAFLSTNNNNKLIQQKIHKCRLLRSLKLNASIL